MFCQSLIFSIFAQLLLQTCGVRSEWAKLSYEAGQCSKSGEDFPFVSVQESWVHAGEKNTVTLHCLLCKDPNEEKNGRQYKVWWSKDGERVKSSSRIHQIAHQKKHFLLRIRKFKTKDFGTYVCGVDSRDSYGRKRTSQGKIEVSGVPYPAQFDLPSNWSESTYKLSWKVNSSIPIINYQLEFRQISPNIGKWLEINVPGDFGEPRLQQRSHNNMAPLGSMEDDDDLIHQQSYTLKGLKKETSYEARVRSRNLYGLSAISKTVSFHTFDIKDNSEIGEYSNLEEQNYREDDEQDNPFVMKTKKKKQEEEEEREQLQVLHKDQLLNDAVRSMDANSEPLSISKKEHEQGSLTAEGILGHSVSSRNLLSPLSITIAFSIVQMWQHSLKMKYFSH